MVAAAWLFTLESSDIGSCQGNAPSEVARCIAVMQVSAPDAGSF